MKKVKINNLLPREIIDIGVTNGYCPQNVIDSFLRRYSVERIGVLLFQLQMLPVYGRCEVPIYIETDDEDFLHFRKELEDLLKAVYLEYRYSRKAPIKFVDKGGKHGC